MLERQLISAVSLEIDNSGFALIGEFKEKPPLLGYLAEDLVKSYLQSIGYETIGWDDPYDKDRLPLPHWVSGSEEICSFLRESKWFDILAAGENGALCLIEVKSRAILPEKLREPEFSRFIFKFDFGKPPDYYQPPYDDPMCWEGGRALKAIGLGIRFSVAVCYSNMASKRFYLGIFDEDQINLYNSGFTLFPTRGHPENQGIREKIIRALGE